MRDVIEVILPIGNGRRVRLDGPAARRLLARGLAVPVVPPKPKPKPKREREG